jgi:hypothetical protein
VAFGTFVGKMSLLAALEADHFVQVSHLARLVGQVGGDAETATGLQPAVWFFWKLKNVVIA